LFAGNAKNRMTITAIAFGLIIVLFGFDSTKQVKTRSQRTGVAEGSEPRT